jgi:hypothetical protein
LAQQHLRGPHLSNYPTNLSFPIRPISWTKRRRSFSAFTEKKMPGGRQKNGAGEARCLFPEPFYVLPTVPRTFFMFFLPFPEPFYVLPTVPRTFLCSSYRSQNLLFSFFVLLFLLLCLMFLSLSLSLSIFLSRKGTSFFNLDWP